MFLLKYVALQCYNSTTTANGPGDLDTNLAGLTLNPIPSQNQTSSSNIGLSSHRKDNNR